MIRKDRSLPIEDTDFCYFVSLCKCFAPLFVTSCFVCFGYAGLTETELERPV